MLWNMRAPGRPAQRRPADRPGEHGVLAGLQLPRVAPGRGQRGQDGPALERGRPGGPEAGGHAADRPGELRAVGGVQPGRRRARRGQRGQDRPAVGRVRPGAPEAAGQAADRPGPAGRLGRVQPGRPDAGRREPGRQGLAVERDHARPAGPGRRPDRGHRLGERGRVQPGRAQPGRGQQRRPGAGLEPGHRALAAELPQPQPVTSLAWDSDGHLVAGDADGRVRTWVAAHPGAARGRRGEQRRLRPTTGRLLAVGGPGLQLWDPVTRRELAAAAAPGPAGTIVNAVAFSPAGPRWRPVTATGTCSSGRSPHGRSLARLSRPVRASAKGLVEFTAFSPRRPAAGHRRRRRDRAAVVGHRPGTPPAGRDRARLAHLRVLGGVQPGRAHARGRERGRPDPAVEREPARPPGAGSARRWQGPASYAISVAFSPDGRILAVGSADRTVRLWNVADLARPVPGRLAHRPGRLRVLGELQPGRPHARRRRDRRHRVAVAGDGPGPAVAWSPR